MESDRLIRATWNDDKGWTKINSEREWKEIMQWAGKISAPKDNEGFSRHLLLSVLRKKELVSRLET